MFTVAICDDDKSFRDLLRNYLEQFFRKQNQPLTILEFENGESLLYRPPYTADILFLDIQMGIRDGIETAKSLRKEMPELCILFATNLPQYALQSYEVKPFGFLTKPLEYDRFESELSLAMKHIARNETHRISFKGKGPEGMKTVSTREILFLESRDHYIVLTTKDKEESIFLGSLNEWEKELKPFGFIRCHQSFLVNYRHIAGIKDELELEDGTRIPISRSRRKTLLSDFTALVGRHIW